MRTGSDVDARLAAADAWLAAGLSSALQPALRDGTSLRGLKAICEIAFFVATRLRRYDPILVQAVDDCLAQVLDGGRLLGMARHNIQHANLFLPLLYACFRRGLLDRRSVAMSACWPIWRSHKRWSGSPFARSTCCMSVGS
jgi:hypothetical protein